MKVYEVLREIVNDEGLAEDFVNSFFETDCVPECRVECNNHYTEGPELEVCIGCFVKKYMENEALKYLTKIAEENDWHNYIDFGKGY